MINYTRAKSIINNSDGFQSDQIESKKYHMEGLEWGQFVDIETLPFQLHDQWDGSFVLAGNRRFPKPPKKKIPFKLYRSRRHEVIPVEPEEHSKADTSAQPHCDNEFFPSVLDFLVAMHPKAGKNNPVAGTRLIKQFLAASTEKQLHVVSSAIVTARENGQMELLATLPQHYFEQ